MVHKVHEHPGRVAMSDAGWPTNDPPFYAVEDPDTFPATEPDFTVRTIAAWVPASREVLEDAPNLLALISQRMREAMLQAEDRRLRPWLFRDPDPLRRFDVPLLLFPRWERTARRCRETRRRMAGDLAARYFLLREAVSRHPSRLVDEEDEW
jgi:hypothetical protein